MTKAMTGLGWATVLAFDPGGTTGWCVFCVTPRDLISERAWIKCMKHCASGQILGSEHAQVDQSIELIDMWPEAAVVSESFHQRIRNTGLETDPAYSPVRINATIKWWLATEDRFHFKQSPDLAKSAWTDERLRAAKLEPGGGYANRHARDGVRHALTFLGRARQQKRLRGSAFPLFFDEKGELL
jgi:hypothetical protein